MRREADERPFWSHLTLIYGIMATDEAQQAADAGGLKVHKPKGSIQDAPINLHKINASSVAGIERRLR